MRAVWLPHIIALDFARIRLGDSLPANTSPRDAWRQRRGTAAGIGPSLYICNASLKLTAVASRRVSRHHDGAHGKVTSLGNT